MLQVNQKNLKLELFHGRSIEKGCLSRKIEAISRFLFMFDRLKRVEQMSF